MKNKRTIILCLKMAINSDTQL